MSGFVSAESNGFVHWKCDPSGAKAHHALLVCLTEIVRGQFLPAGGTLSNRQKGNLGEFTAFFVGDRCSFLGGYHPFAANALRPLADISRPDVDIVWLFIGGNPADDKIVLQEVKATASADLEICRTLTTDYAKLFGTDSQLTLKTRLSAIKSSVEFEWRQPNLARRVNRFLGGPRASDCREIQVMPTLVFDSSTAQADLAQRRLIGVRTTVCGLGWDTTQVTLWAIGIEELENHFQLLASGQSYRANR